MGLEEYAITAHEVRTYLTPMDWLYIIVALSLVGVFFAIAGYMLADWVISILKSGGILE